MSDICQNCTAQGQVLIQTKRGSVFWTLPPLYENIKELFFICYLAALRPILAIIEGTSSLTQY